MELAFNGHACVTLRAGDGRTLVMDPYLSGALGGAIRFTPVEADADWVTVSHYHVDHCHVGRELGTPTVIDRSQRVAGVDFQFIPTFHDAHGGTRMGLTQMVTFMWDGLRIAHLGDIGCALTPDDVQALGRIDILLWPTGGLYTLGPEDAPQVLDLLQPRLAIPMHYEHAGCALGLAPVDATLARLDGHSVVRPSGGTWSSASGLPDASTVLALEPVCGP